MEPVAVIKSFAEVGTITGGGSLGGYGYSHGLFIMSIQDEKEGLDGTSSGW